VNGNDFEVPADFGHKGHKDSEGILCSFVSFPLRPSRFSNRSINFKHAMRCCMFVDAIFRFFRKHAQFFRHENWFEECFRLMDSEWQFGRPKMDARRAVLSRS